MLSAFNYYLIFGILVSLGILVLSFVIFYTLVKNAVKNGVFEAKLKYLDYIEECNARAKQDKYNSDLDD